MCVYARAQHLKTSSAFLDGFALAAKQQQQQLTWMVLEMAIPTAEAPRDEVSATDSSAVATTMMAPNRSHQKDSHKWHQDQALAIMDDSVSPRVLREYLHLGGVLRPVFFSFSGLPIKRVHMRQLTKPKFHQAAQFPVYATDSGDVN
eukprot:1159055-Pelagomonas_calceolata.AAC.7